MYSKNRLIRIILIMITLIMQVVISCKEDNQNTPPVAAFSVDPATGTLSTIFTFDASLSYDKEDLPEELRIRWDWQNDGNWDTPYSNNKIETYQYTQAGVQVAKLEVIDSDGATDAAGVDITVTGGGGGGGIPCPDLPTVVYEGRTYNTVQIGTQCWLKENLNIGTRINGTQESNDNQVIEKYCMNNNEYNCEIYGALYQWNEMMQYTTEEGARGICPQGWHIPAKSEWDKLVNELGGINQAGGKLKESGTVHWNPPNLGATNSSGFTALGAGYRNMDGIFGNFMESMTIWTSTEENNPDAWWGQVYFISMIADNSFYDKKDARSIRCIKD